MDGEEAGARPPVVIVRPTPTSPAAWRHAEARPSSRRLGDLIRGTYGPNGLDKMLYKSNGETAVTTTGPASWPTFLVKHPAAKTFVSMAETQENAAAMASRVPDLRGELMREGGACSNAASTR
ncbi:MAG: hypothetical protein CM15mP18_4140 [Methanobacteriota archaeon]|nr:MAG: hypothetical protein CM15mP18_4140 [Euryarchaeota archaeon]